MVAELTTDRLVTVLAATPLFGGLDRASLEGLARGGVLRHYKRDQYLWVQGDPGDHLVVVVSGRVKVVVTSESGDELVLVTLGRAESLGELAVLDALPRSASAVAAEPAAVLRISRVQLHELMRSNPAVMEALMASVGALVRRLTEQASDLVFLDLTGRVAKLLVQLVDDKGPARSGPATLDLGLTQTDLAHMVGASRPALNRILQALSSRGWISVEGRRIVVRDRAGLRRRAGL